MKKPIVDTISLYTGNSSLMSNLTWKRSTEDKNPKGVLTITFNANGDVYEYTKVPYSLIIEMLSSDSLGQFFHNKIRDKYDTNKKG